MASGSPRGRARGWTAAIPISAALESGSVWVNTCRAVSFMAPVRRVAARSGLGRENGGEAIHEYLQTKTVWIETEPKTETPFVMRRLQHYPTGASLRID